VTVVAWSLLGASLGFLASNFPPAKILLGESGSTVLGFLLAFLALDAYRVVPSTNSLPLFPPIFASLPLVDAAVAVLRRLRKSCSPISGDRRHLYDALLATGWPAQKVALTSYAVTISLVGAGWLTMSVGSGEAVLIFAICLTALLLAALRLGLLKSREEVSRVRAAKTEAYSETRLLQAVNTYFGRR
jgi:UDP-GlcNAc:undecaprenyl-phosphate GlcNAc-1-phosphate transferase